MELDRLDHLVLTVIDIPQTCAFYRRLGMEVITFNGDRKALRWGKQKINLHQAGAEFQPHAASPMPGSADLCFITTTPLTEVISHLKQSEIDIIEGPVERSGACGALLSVYVRDPDLNLIEIANER